MKDKILTSLNDQQREAVKYFDNPLLIIASAGSGKTRVLTHKIAYLINTKKIPAYSILGVTFTNKAANEMKERVSEMVKGHDSPPTLSTFHSFGLRILRENAKEVGFDKDWRVIDSNEQQGIINKLIKKRYDSIARDTREKIRQSINLAKMNMLFPNNKQMLMNKGFVGREVDVYLDYQNYLTINKMWDYEDLISLPVKILQSNQKIYEKFKNKFKYILVDEFQDINPNQYELIKLIDGQRNKITIVGDDDQAIYSWRGADIKFLDRFESDFPQCHVIKLERNYRSTKQILDFANQLIDKNKNRKTKKMWTDKTIGQKVCVFESYSKVEEAEKIADFIKLCKTSHPEYFPIAILYRINVQSLAFETALGQRGIKFKIVKGLRFFQRKEIKDCLALLKLVMNPQDDLAFLRVVDFLPLGIGSRSQEQIVTLAQKNDKSLFDVLRNDMEDKYHAKPLLPFIYKLHQKRDNFPISKILEKLVNKSNYLNLLEEKKEEARKLNIKEFIKFLSTWGKNNKVQDFSTLLDYIQLNEGDQEEKTNEDVLLLTMHNAKGLEFPCVVVSGVNQTYLPFFLRIQQEEIEEERRLLYVALTRAIKKLIVSTGSMQPSIFLGDIKRSSYYNADAIKDIISEGEVTQNSYEINKPGQELILKHPMFGTGRVLNSLGENKYYVKFEDDREVVVDISLIKAKLIGN